MKRFPPGIFGRVCRSAFAGSVVVAIAVLASCGGSQAPPVPLVISPSSLPNVSTGNEVQFPIEASGGTGSYTWSISSGSLPHGLSLSPNPPGAVISGTPDTAAQAVPFTVRVTDPAGGSGSQQYTVSVLIGADSLTLSPSALNFAPQLVATPSTQQTITVTNAILSPITISSVSASSSGDFNDTTTCNSTLAAGDSCTIAVVFTPAQAGVRGGSITVTDDTQGSPHSVALNGTGVVSGPNATFSAANLQFGDVKPGTTSPTQAVTLNNYGTDALDVAGFNPSADFAETDNCATPVASAASCTINVTFSPTSIGQVDGMLSVADNAAGSPQTVTLTGSGAKCQTLGQTCSTLFACCSGLQCTVNSGPGGQGASCQ